MNELSERPLGVTLLPGVPCPHVRAEKTDATAVLVVTTGNKRPELGSSTLASIGFLPEQPSFATEDLLWMGP